MKTLFATSLFSPVLGLLLLADPLLAQGPLAPPGPPAPMMKTLQQMEPRTHIEAAGYVITAPGSYYLTANLNGGGTVNGIVVQVSGVTIDLRGFSILNCPVGLSAAAGVRSVAVANGSVRNCTGAGVDLSLAEQCRLEGVIASNNAGDGASVGGASLVTLCTAASNGGRGLALGNGGTVFRCVAQANANSGIVIASNCQATENTCTGNGGGTGQAGLLTTGASNRVEGNSANQNNGQGFQINGTGNLVIRNNACSNTVADYAMAAGNNFGQILLSPGAGFVNSNAWANFGCGAQSATCQTAAECDDGNGCTTDICEANACVHTPIAGCGTAICGNGIVEAGEQCDDGNTVPGDGCTQLCQLESGSCVNGSTQSCYGGPAGTLGVGACHAGTQTCSGGAWGACVGQSTPSVEACDGLDNNCNGVVDDGNPNGGMACNTGLQGVCAAGTTACTGGGLVCVGSVGPSAEICDGLDNNCNGVVDDGVSCGAVCGNGIVEAGEACDDNNLTNGDGCTATCTVQAGFSCAGSPSVCVSNSFVLVVSKNGTGTGTVTTSPAGIYCGAVCAANFASGTPVTLTAMADAGSAFAGWTGACSGTGTCAVTMNSATSVSATFILSSQACTTDSQCNDGNPCSTDVCQIATGTCTHGIAPNNTACSDGNACTQSDTCQNGTCTGGSPVTCVAVDLCHQAGTCNPATGACTDGSPITCAASDQCHQAGTCNPATGACTNPAKADGSACTDGNACTQSDFCQAGICTGANPVTCQTGTCNPATGVCQALASCSDGIKNGTESGVDCGGGSCAVCAPGQTCALGSDCASHVCAGGVCQTASCSDMVKNGTETDVDCGGGTCGVCSSGHACNAGSDCSSGRCASGVCQAL